MRNYSVRSSALLLTLFIAGIVSACTTVTPQQSLQMDRSRCQTIGFPANSVAMAECVQRYELDRRADGRARQVALDHWMHDRPLIYGWPYRSHYGYRHRSW